MVQYAHVKWGSASLVELVQDLKTIYITGLLGNVNKYESERLGLTLIAEVRNGVTYGCQSMG